MGDNKAKFKLESVTQLEQELGRRRGTLMQLISNREREQLRISAARDEYKKLETEIRELDEALRARVTAIGLEVVSLGIRDVILPGEMKDLMNKVTEARKAAEASLITRREETAAMRSQANTAKILETNPTLMRLRELEALEKVAEKANLQVLLSENGLTERITKLV